ncbi:MAG: DUF2723 domain-containing protein [Chloroflexi bacterium]|nr:DUF2723 domain-containing protein [Chloroflexota bacterium]
MITAAATGGLAHPTGYPLYLILARGFQLIPIGSLAFRTNLLSAVAAVLAALLIYFVVIDHLSPSGVEKSPRWLAGLVSAYAFGLSPLVWSQAVITEVYTLNAFFIALILFLVSNTVAQKTKQKNLDLMLGLTFGLAAGNHVTIILTSPILLFSKAFVHAATGKWHYDARSLYRRIAWIGTGLLVYLTLPLRAFSKPPVNWGNPSTFEGFKWLVTGQLYQDQIFALTPALVLERVRAIAGLLIGQFGIPGLLFGLMGGIVFYKRSQLHQQSIWIFFAYSVLALGYAAFDSFVYLIPAFLSFSIWIGLGVSGTVGLVSQKSQRIGNSLSIIFVVYLFVLSGSHWRQVDASRDTRAESFGKEVLAEAQEDSIVFAKGDKAIFTMWYFHFALHQRADIVVIAPDLLHFDWYRESLRLLYPQLVITDAEPTLDAVKAANHKRPVCFIDYILDAIIDCAPYPNP